MRYSKEHKEKTRSRILDAAHKKFRSDGYFGIGVDGIAKGAGVTSGAFYGHFGSKSEAFQTVAVEGLTQLRKAIEVSRDKDPDNQQWPHEFSRWYFSTPRRTSKSQKAALLPMQGGCALPGLSPEVARADEKTKKAYQKELLQVVKTFAEGLPEDVNAKEKRSTTWALLALMAGGVVLARSVNDKKVANEISRSALVGIEAMLEHLE